MQNRVVDTRLLAPLRISVEFGESHDLSKSNPHCPLGYLHRSPITNDTFFSIHKLI